MNTSKRAASKDFHRASHETRCTQVPQNFDAKCWIRFSHLLMQVSAKKKVLPSLLPWFSLHVDAAGFAAWLEQGRQNLIGEFETLTVALALNLWGQCVASSQLMIFIDKRVPSLP